MRTDKDNRKLLSMLPHGNNLFPVCAHAAIHIEIEDDLKTCYTYEGQIETEKDNRK